MMHPEHLIHKIGQNQRVRSKSEAMIGKALQNNRIPFRYECALELAGNIYYPDFTIRHPRTGSVVYWEHFGMMDDPGYMRHMLAKLEIYLLNQMIPGVNLIITFETRDNPLTFETIDEQIKFYLL